MNAISIKNLRKSYDDFEALKGISLDIKDGDFFGFLGPNGAGKTTTINCIIGLSTFSQGSIAVYGKDVVSQYRESRKLIGVSHQEYNFDPYLSLRDVLIYQAGYYGLSKSKILGRVDSLLKQFKLFEKRDMDFRKLSGGMKRRLALARAVVHKPKILILDEPTAGVDVELRHDIHDFLKKVNEEGTTIVLTSHYLEEVEKLCNRIVIIDHGKIIANDSTAKLVNNLDSGHTEIILEKKAPKIDVDCVESKGKKVIVWNRCQNIDAVIKHLHKQKCKIIEVKTIKDSLEDVFLRLTKK